MDDQTSSVDETIHEMISSKDYNAIIQMIGDMARKDGVAISPNIMATLPTHHKMVAKLEDHVLLEEDRALFGDLSLGWHLSVIRHGKILHLEKINFARTSNTFSKDIWRLHQSLMNYYSGVDVSTEIYAVHHRFGFLCR